MHITVRCPVVEVDGTLVALVIGKAEAEFGDEVVVEAVQDGKTIAGLFVASVDTAPADTLAPDVLALFGATDVASFHSTLERTYGTGLPLTIPVTIYTLYDRPVEASAS